MDHRILPRFMNGLEIFTDIKHPVDLKRKAPNSFIFLVEKDGLFIKNVEPSFFELTRFKVSQRNIKLLQELALDSIFQEVSLLPSSNVPHQTALLPEFIEEFTYIKPASKKKPSNKSSQTNIGFTRKKPEGDQLFDYAVLKSSREDDPYVQVLFELKSRKREEKESNDGSQS